MANPQTKKQFELLAYKLLHDVLLLGLISILGLLIMDALVPNYFFSAAGFAKILLLFFAALGLTGWLGRRNGLAAESISAGKIKNNKLLLLLFALSMALVVNSFRSLNWPWLIITSVLASMILFYLYKFLTLSDK